MNNSIRNYSFDTLKCIMCFFVILIHSSFYGKMYINGIIDIAVPIFFMISGFFLPPPYYISDNQVITERRKLTKILKHIFLLIIGGSILYLLWRLFLVIISNYEIIFRASDIITCDNSLAAHFWYLHTYLYMLLFALIINYLGIRFSSIKVLPFILLVLHLLLGQCDNTYIIKFVLRVFCMALAFGSYGIFCRKYSIPKYFYLPLIIIGVILCACQNVYHFYSYNQGYSVGTIILSLGMFPLFKDLNLKQNILSDIGMKYSMHIYIVHWIFIDIIGFVGRKIPEYNSIGLLINPILVFIFSISASIIYTRFKKMIKYE